MAWVMLRNLMLIISKHYKFCWLAISEIGTELAPLHQNLTLIQTTECRFHNESGLIVRLE
jgi:hypothetical protein